MSLDKNISIFEPKPIFKKPFASLSNNFLYVSLNTSESNFSYITTTPPVFSAKYFISNKPN